MLQKLRRKIYPLHKCAVPGILASKVIFTIFLTSAYSKMDFPTDNCDDIMICVGTMIKHSYTLAQTTALWSKTTKTFLLAMVPSPTSSDGYNAVPE